MYRNQSIVNYPVSAPPRDKRGWELWATPGVCPEAYWDGQPGAVSSWHQNPLSRLGQNSPAGQSWRIGHQRIFLILFSHDGSTLSVNSQPSKSLLLANVTARQVISAERRESVGYDREAVPSESLGEEGAHLSQVADNVQVRVSVQLATGQPSFLILFSHDGSTLSVNSQPSECCYWPNSRLGKSYLRNGEKV